MAIIMSRAAILFTAFAPLAETAPQPRYRNEGRNHHHESCSSGSYVSSATLISSSQSSAAPYPTDSSSTLIKGPTVPLGTGAPKPLSTGTTQSSPSNLTPNGRKAGSAGGRAVPHWQDHLGWWYDWTPSPPQHGSLTSVSMLWGGGNNGDVDAQRFSDFSKLTEAPKYLLGFNEPDCKGSMSASVSVDDAVRVWNENIAPWGAKGSLLGSPSMCMQLAEKWLDEFNGRELERGWDFTAVHIYKPDIDRVKQDIEHYWGKYGKPIWVTEFACVYDQDGFRACDDQGQVDQWIKDVVDLFEGDERVMAYGYTDEGGLNDVWLPTNEDGGQLSESGKTYLEAISNYS